MNKEICNYCKKMMGNSLNKENGVPIHKRCKRRMETAKELKFKFKK